MRKIWVVLLCVLLVAALVACADASLTPDADSVPDNAADAHHNPSDTTLVDVPSNTASGSDTLGTGDATSTDTQQSDAGVGSSETPTQTQSPDIPEITAEDTPSDDTPATPTADATTAALVSIQATCALPQQSGTPLRGVKVMATYDNDITEEVTDYVLQNPYASYHSQTADTLVTYSRQGVTVQCTMRYTLQQNNQSAHDVYFTNTANWAKVCAYVWRDADKASPIGWPGTPCTFVETNRYGQGVWRYTVPTGYDRIIFNDGSDNNKTADLVVNRAVSGYYADGSETAGTYAYGAQEYGTLRQVTLEAPELGGTGYKKVYIHTPVGYNSSRVYKVLYCFDGQNLFESRKGQTPCSDNTWQLDVAIASLGCDLIVVGIDNGEGASVRDSQLTMSSFGPLSPLGDAKYGNFANGCLDELGNWMRQTLAPYIRSQYSVSTQRSDTYIAGSSSGGLAALYLGLRDRDIYGAICALSPASGLFYTDAWRAFLAQTDNSLPQYVLLYCGYNGTDQLENILYDATAMGQNIASCNTLGQLLRQAGYTQRSAVEEIYWQGAIHREEYWRLMITHFFATVVE